MSRRFVRCAEVEWARADCLLPDCGWRYRGADAVDIADEHHDETGHPTETKEHVVVRYEADSNAV